MDFVIIRDMSAGNAETGEAWQETKIFSETATLKEVMDWAEKDNRNHDVGYSRKRIQITRPHKENTNETISNRSNVNG